MPHSSFDSSIWWRHHFSQFHFTSAAAFFAVCFSALQACLFAACLRAVNKASCALDQKVTVWTAQLKEKEDIIVVFEMLLQCLQCQWAVWFGWKESKSYTSPFSSNRCDGNWILNCPHLVNALGYDYRNTCKQKGREGFSAQNKRLNLCVHQFESLSRPQTIISIRNAAVTAAHLASFLSLFLSFPHSWEQTKTQIWNMRQCQAVIDDDGRPSLSL